MADRHRGTSGSVLFAVTIFTSAFLLFQVQPLLAKFILPWFGGTPAVWMLLSHDVHSLDVVCGPDTSEAPHRVVYWTDDRNNLLNVLR